MLRSAGWEFNGKSVERLWRREGLKVPMQQSKTGRNRPNDESCVRLKAEHRDHVWSYDFVHYRTDDGKVFRTLKESQIMIEKWRKHHNSERSHGALGYKPPAPESIHLTELPPEIRTLT